MSEKSLSIIQTENLELLKENSALKETITILMNEVDRLRLPTITGVATKIQRTSEESIIEVQIKQLEIASNQRVLSLEEVRTLDLLIKNKKLLEPQDTLKPDYTEVPPGSTEGDLLRIAGNVEVKSKRKSKTGSKDPVA